MLTRFLPIPPLNVPREIEGYRLRNAKDYLLFGNNFDLDVQLTALSSFLQNISIEHHSDITFDTSNPVIRAPQKILLKATRGTDVLNTYIDLTIDPPITNNTEFIEHTHPLPEHTHALPEHTHDLPEHTHALPEHTHDLPEHTHDLPEHTHALPEHTHYIPGHGHAPATTDEGMPGEQVTGPPQMLSLLFDFIHLFTPLWQPYLRKAQWWIYSMCGFGMFSRYGN